MNNQSGDYFFYHFPSFMQKKFVKLCLLRKMIHFKKLFCKNPQRNLLCIMRAKPALKSTVADLLRVQNYTDMSVDIRATR